MKNATIFMFAPNEKKQGLGSFMRWGQPIYLHFKRIIRLREPSRSKIRGKLPENEAGMAMSSLGRCGIFLCKATRQASEGGVPLPGPGGSKEAEGGVG